MKFQEGDRVKIVKSVRFKGVIGTIDKKWRKDQWHVSFDKPFYTDPKCRITGASFYEDEMEHLISTEPEADWKDLWDKGSK